VLRRISLLQLAGWKLAVLSLIAVPSTAWSQDQSGGGEAIKDRATDLASGGPSTSATFGTLANAIQLETSGDDTSATVSFGLDWDGPVGDQVKDDDGVVHQSFARQTVSITASAPLGKNGKPSLFDFDGLGDGTSLKIGFAQYQGKVSQVPFGRAGSIPELQSRLANRCIVANSAKWVAGAPSPVKIAERNAVALLLRAKVDGLKQDSGIDAEAALEKLAVVEGDTKELAGLLEKKCVDGIDGGELKGGKTLYTEYATPDERRAYDLAQPGGLWFVGGSAKISRTNYAFVDQVAFKMGDVSRTGYKAELFGGWIFPDGRQSLTASLAYSRSYKAGDDIQLCQTIGVGNQTQCLTGALGAPQVTKKYILAGEYRKLVTLGKLPGSPSMGFTPRVSYEFSSKGMLLELPVYFVPNKEKALNGGIRAAYDTKKDDFAFGLFVGVPFSLFQP
jgi:hypothetical protein